MERKNETRTIVKDINLETFRKELQEAVNNINSTHLNFAQHVQELDKVTIELMDKHAPLIEWKKKDSCPPWLDAEYRIERAMRRKYERKWRKNKSLHNMNNYTQQKKRCSELALEKKTEYYSKLVEDAGKCQKTLFKVANELLDKNEKRVLPCHTDSKALADEFNKFYIEKVQKIRRSIPEVKLDHEFYSQPFLGQPLEILRPTDVEEIETIIKESGIKASVEDPLPAALVKSCLDIMLPVYTDLVNKSLAEGSIENVKTSVIDPTIKKAGLDTDIKNHYRPVNNLRFLSKLTERVAKIRKDEHMTVNALHTPEEFGYKTNHNTETMMIGLTDEVLRGFDENEATIVIFLDLSAAFDTIDPNKLLKIMESEPGITGIALKWFRSFLVGRTQRVKINNAYSDSVEVPCRTPQGSVLGPPLFNTNVRSQPKVFQHCKFNTSAFADDSTGRRTFALTFQYQVIAHEVVKCLKLIVEWSYAHFMKINPDKTEILLFYPPSIEKEVLIRGVLFEEQCIRFSDCVKNVGVHLDKNLNLNTHINNITSHCYKILKDIGSMKKNLNKDHLAQLVHSVITNRLDYCNSLFLNLNKSNIDKLQKVQNAAARLVLGKRRRESARRALNELHWLNVESRIIFKTILIVYKFVKGTCSENIQFTFKSFNGRMDDFLLLNTPNFKSAYGKRIFEYNGSRLWNALSYDMRVEEDVDKFKKSLKTLLFTGTDELKKRVYQYRE